MKPIRQILKRPNARLPEAVVKVNEATLAKITIAGKPRVAQR